MKTWLLSTTSVLMLLLVEAGMGIAETPSKGPVPAQRVQVEAKVHAAKERVIAVWRSHDPVKTTKLQEDMNRVPGDFIPALLDLIDLEALREKPHPRIGIQLRSLSHLVQNCGKPGRDAAIPLLKRIYSEHDQARKRLRRPAAEYGTPRVLSDEEKVIGHYRYSLSLMASGIRSAFEKAHDPDLRDILVARLPNVSWGEQSRILEYLHAVVPNDKEVREVVRRIRDDPKTELHRVPGYREQVNREWNLEP
jgi:hypothetical protein